MTAIELRNVSRWYGNVVAVNDITMTIGPGVTGLLVQIADDATYDQVRDAVADLGLPLNRLEQQRRRVEELFRDQEDPGEEAPGDH